MYYDGLEGTEQVRSSIVLEYGNNAGNDQSRVLNLRNRTFTQPTPANGGRSQPDRL